MLKRTFRLRQTDIGHKDWVSLDFRSLMERPHSLSNSRLIDPIISTVCGDTVDYGSLFAYCFRRFGYPTHGWDDYKELVGYYLKTPSPDLILHVAPNVSNRSSISLSFLIEWDADLTIQDYANRDRLAWGQRMLTWAEKQGLPDWMPEWITVFNSDVCEAYPGTQPTDDWRKTVGVWFALGDSGSRMHEFTSRVVVFNASMREAYTKVEPLPPRYIRPARILDWAPDDPLKPLAEAAMTALLDLHSPVGVRDRAITAFGIANTDKASVKPAIGAGFPSGALGNTTAAEFVELHALVLELGKGNVKRGIAKILKTMAKS